MAQLDRHIADERRHLMEPLESKLSKGMLADYTIETIDQLVTKMNNGKAPAFLMSVPIDVNANESVYSLSNAAFFGKERYLFTVDITNRQHDRREIDLVDMEALTQFYSGGDTSLVGIPYASERHTAEAAAVYRLVGVGPVIEFGPKPPMPASYELIYEASSVRPQSRTDIGLFGMEQFDGYVAALTARRALRHCEWKGLSRLEAADRRREVQEALDYDIGSVRQQRGYEYDFWVYRQRLSARTKPTAIGWADNRL